MWHLLQTRIRSFEDKSQKLEAPSWGSRRFCRIWEVQSGFFCDISVIVGGGRVGCVEKGRGLVWFPSQPPLSKTRALLHLRFSLSFPSSAQSLTGSGYSRTCCFIRWTSSYSTLGRSKYHLWRSLKLLKDPPIDVQGFSAVSCSLVPFECSTGENSLFIK